MRIHEQRSAFFRLKCAKYGRSLIGMSSYVIFFIVFVCYAGTLALADGAVRASYASAVKLATPSVVNLYTDRRIKQRQIHYPFHSNTRRATTLGSAVIIDKRGDLLTNYHVVRNAERILVALNDGRKVLASLLGYDQGSDLAVLRIKLSNLQAASLGNSDDLHVGDVVLAIGNPFGLGQTVTQGIISAIGRNRVGLNQLENYIQTDAAINPGNSGGALINARGEVIGINTAIYSRSGGYQGVGFAIPINVALNVMQQILKTGSVKRGWLGLRIQTLNARLMRRLNFSQASGVVIMGFLPRSPAASAGMKVGDLVTYLNRRRIRTARGFLHYMAQRKPGSNVTVTFIRARQTYRVNVVVGARP